MKIQDDGMNALEQRVEQTVRMIEADDNYAAIKAKLLSALTDAREEGRREGLADAAKMVNQQRCEDFYHDACNCASVVIDKLKLLAASPASALVPERACMQQVGPSTVCLLAFGHRGKCKAPASALVAPRKEDK